MDQKTFKSVCAWAVLLFLQQYKCVEIFQKRRQSDIVSVSEIKSVSSVMRWKNFDTATKILMK